MLNPLYSWSVEKQHLREERWWMIFISVFICVCSHSKASVPNYLWGAGFSGVVDWRWGHFSTLCLQGCWKKYNWEISRTLHFPQSHSLTYCVPTPITSLTAYLYLYLKIVRLVAPSSYPGRGCLGKWQTFSLAGREYWFICAIILSLKANEYRCYARGLFWR